MIITATKWQKHHYICRRWKNNPMPNELPGKLAWWVDLYKHSSNPLYPNWWFNTYVDQGFPWCGEAHDILVGPQSKMSARSLSPILRDYVLHLSNVYVLLQQASELCMHCPQESVPRLKTLPNDSKTRKCIIESIVLLTNFQIQFVGLDQIKTVLW